MTQSTKTPKSSILLPIIIGVAIFFIAAFALGSFLIYNYIVIPDQIAKSINKNVDLINNSSNKSKELYNDLTKKLDTGSAEESLKVLKNAGTGLTNLSQTIETDKKALEDGQNEDTKALASEARNLLDQEVGLANSMQKSITQQICVVESTQTFTSKFKEAETALTSAPVNDDVKLITNLNQAATSIDEGNVSITSLKDCFTGSYEKYLTTDLTKAIADDSALYTRFSAALRALSLGVKNQSIAQVNAANKDIQTITSVDSKLDKQADLVNLSNAPKKDLQAALDELQKAYDKYDSKANEIAKKYNLKLEK